MSLGIGDNFDYKGAKPLDNRIKYDTVSAMAGTADTTLYDGCIAYCVEDDKTYQWKSTNTSDPTLGKWREFVSGGDMSNYYTKSEVDTKVGKKEDKFRVETMPEPSLELTGKVVQYIGTTTENYKNGFFYECFTGVDGYVEFDQYVSIDFETFTEYLQTAIPSTYQTATHGTFTYIGDNVWKLTVLDASDNTLHEYQQYVPDWRAVGFTFISTPSSEGEAANFLYAYMEHDIKWIELEVQNNHLKTMPLPNSSYEDKVVKYIGETTGNFVKGETYQCVAEYTCDYTVNVENAIRGPGVAIMALVQYIVPTRFKEVRSVEVTDGSSSGKYTISCYNLTGSLLGELSSVVSSYFTAFGVQAINLSGHPQIYISNIRSNFYKWVLLEENRQAVTARPNMVEDRDMIGQYAIWDGSSNIAIPGTIVKFEESTTGEYNLKMTEVLKQPYKKISVNHTERSNITIWGKLTLGSRSISKEGITFIISCGRDTVGILQASGSASPYCKLHMLHQGIVGDTSDYIAITALKSKSATEIAFKIAGGGTVSVAQVSGGWNDFTYEKSTSDPTDENWTTAQIMVTTETVYTQS